jgi:hypothetical protein
MTDSMRAAREDLAFLKAVAEDRGPLPGPFGWNLFAAGLVVGVNLIAFWAVTAARGGSPSLLNSLWSWGPGTVVYLPLSVMLYLRGRHVPLGPSARVFGAAWAAMLAMTLTILIGVVMARIATGKPFEEVWPAIAFGLYGGAWTVVGLTRRRLWILAVAIGCFLTAVACAALIEKPALYLALGVGVLLFFGAPGAVIMFQARRRAEA